MRSVEEKEVRLPLGIIVEKRKSKHPWADWNWRPVAVYVALNGRDDEANAELFDGPDFKQYRAGILFLELHHKDAEALRLNLMQDAPELYVVLREAEDGTELPWEPFLVTASPYEAQDFTDAGDDIIEKVAMPEVVAAFIQAFVEEHYVEQEFKKRRRDKLNVDDQKFGKTPIFETHTKH